MFKKYILPLIIALVLGAANFYVTLPAINIKSAGFWSWIIFMVVVYIVAMLIFKGVIKIKSIINGKYKR